MCNYLFLISSLISFINSSTGIEIGDSSSKSVAKVASNSNTASGEAVAEVIDDTEIVPEVEVVKVEEPKVEIKAVSNDDVDVYVKALNRKNRIVDIFKEMILSSLNGQSENDDIKNIDAKISISIA